jgi:hypothetical protein
MANARPQRAPTRREHRGSGAGRTGAGTIALLVFALLSLAVAAPPGTAEASSSNEDDRSVVLVPPLPGHDESSVEAFNDAAQVAGYSWDSEEPGERRAFRFDPDGTLHDLGPGLDIAGMDEQGRVAGTIGAPAQRAVLWTEDDGLTDRSRGRRQAGPRSCPGSRAPSAGPACSTSTTGAT